MTKRLLIGYLAVTVMVLLLLEIPLALFYSQRELDRLTSAIGRDASVIATVYEDALEGRRDLDPQAADLYETRTGARVVVVDDVGTALVDTGGPVPSNFANRPEIAAALKGSLASGKRSSATLGSDLVFVAVPVASGGIVHGAVRITLGTGRVENNIHRFWAGLVLIAATVLTLMAGVGWAIAHSVSRPIRRLSDTAARFARGDLRTPEQTADGPPEVRALADTMSRMAVHLAAQIDEQRAFVADASHQLRTPLTSLRLRLENVQTRVPASEAAELDAAIGETDRLAVLVTDLLQLARADRSERVESVDLARIATDRVDTWGAVAEMKGAVLRLDGALDPVIVSATHGAIEQILDNTLDNALNASPPGGMVTITVERGGDTHILRISDQGHGLSDPDKERALRRFWRGPDPVRPAVPTANYMSTDHMSTDHMSTDDMSGDAGAEAHAPQTSAPSGSGLGLPIAAALATASGGSLTLSDADGHGLVVTLRFPAARSTGKSLDR